MQFTNVFVLAMASIASVAVAKSCNKGGVYCGQSLLNKGNYENHILAVLAGVGQPTDQTHVVNSLFNCLSGGDIAFQKFCANGCGGVGSTEADYCL